eukprot:358569-Chlamydomonas_euryale.AAC.2
MTEAVSPAAEEPLPEVYTLIGATLDANLRNCDFAVDGSPSSSTLMSPRRLVPSGNVFREPPNSSAATAFLTSSPPKMLGAMRAKRSSWIRSLFEKVSNLEISSCRCGRVRAGAGRVGMGVWGWRYGQRA